MSRRTSEIKVVRLAEPDLARQTQALLAVLGFQTQTPTMDKMAEVEVVTAEDGQTRSTAHERAEVHDEI